MQTAEASTATDRLSWRSGYINPLGDSIFMQGTHVLIDRDSELICLIEAKAGGPDLESYNGEGLVAITGVITNTIEGKAQIMEVRLVEKLQ